MEDERLRKVGALQTFVSRPELGSVFGLAIIVITFMTLTTSVALSRLCGPIQLVFRRGLNWLLL